MKMTVKEVSDLTGASVRTLHYYHSEGILIPREVSQNNYRYYDEDNLKKLQNILFLRELDFSIQEIKHILSDPNYDQIDSFKKQRSLLLLKRNRLDNLITLLDKKIKGESNMNFKPFDIKKIEERKKLYGEEVKERWGNTPAYSQSNNKTDHYTSENWEAIHNEAENIYTGFIENMDKSPEAPEVQELVLKWQQHISNHYYDCTKEILSGLGLMYVHDERFKENIDEHHEGLAQFMSDSIRIYCLSK